MILRCAWIPRSQRYVGRSSSPYSSSIIKILVKYSHYHHHQHPVMPIASKNQGLVLYQIWVVHLLTNITINNTPSLEYRHHQYSSSYDWYYYTLFSNIFFPSITTTRTTIRRVSKAKWCIHSWIIKSNSNKMRLMQWRHWLASFNDFKINNVNGTSHYHHQQKSRHTDQHTTRMKIVITNLIVSYPFDINNKQSEANDFILFLLLDEIDDSSYHAKIFNIFSISTMIFRAAHSPQSAVLIEINHWFHSWYKR
jgi:CRISPR/Cas system-associated endonuclease/helicase Cas3